MTATDDDFYLTAPSGVIYHLPRGQEVERIDGFIRRMQLSKSAHKFAADIDALLDARVMYAATTETGDTP